MSKKPPVPAESQSPYPIEEPSHAHHDNETLAVVREMAAAKARRAGPSARQLGIGAAVGVGSAAIVAALLYWKGNRKEGK